MDRLLITFEGPEGAGKSTAMRTVAESLRADGVDVVTTREPGAGDFGSKIRALLLEGAEVGIKSELFLFLADRANHVETVIVPALRRGDLVLCDRFADSTVVYQGYGRGFSLEDLRHLNTIATGSVTPALTFLFDLPVEIGLSRITSGDRLDREPLEFHRRVRDGFLAEASREPHRWIKVDATLPTREVAEFVVHAIRERLDMKSAS